MARAFGSLLVLGALCGSVTGQTNDSVYDPNAENTWITADDRQVSQWAKAAVARWCAGGYKGDLEAIEASKDDMQNEIGDNNIIMTILEENATTDEEIQPIIQENIRSFAMVVLPLVLMVLVILVWLFCCWSACCPCCRRCGKKREKSNICNIIQLVVMLALFVALGVIYLGIDHANGNINDGIDNMMCASSQLLDTALNGENKTMGFIGMMPVLEKFFFIEQQMKENSPLMRDFNDILARTAEIEESVVLVADTLRLLSGALNDQRNVYPMKASGDGGSTLYHTCRFCEQAGPAIADMTQGLEEGIGNALNKARAEVKSQLTYSKRKELMSGVDTAAEPLKTSKDSLTQFLKVFVDPSAITDENKDAAENAMWLAFLMVSMIALLLVLCGCCSTACCVLRFEKNGEPSTLAPRCACVVWCFSFLFIIVVFFLTFFLSLINAPSTQICGFMEALDSSVLTTIATAQGLNQTEDGFVMAKGLVDVCWDGTKINGGSNLLDLLFMRKDDGSKETMREKLVGEVTSPIDAAFAEIQSRLSNASMNLADSDAFVDLKNLLSSSDMRETLTVSDQYLPTAPGGGWAADADYQAMVADADLGTVWPATQSTCPDYTPPGTSDTLYGIQKFVQDLETVAGDNPGTAECTNNNPRTVDCSGAGLRQPACDAGNKFMELKSYFADTSKTIWECPKFATRTNPSDPSSPLQSCDVMGMGNAASNYANDCLREHQAGYKFTEQYNESCSTADFATYVQDFGTRLDKVVRRLDAVTTTTFDIVVTDLRALVDRYFVDQIDEVADGISCGFLPPIKNNFIDSLCFQGLAGFKVITNMYFITALLVIVLAFDMYVLFRVMIDNATIKAKEEVSTTI